VTPDDTGGVRHFKTQPWPQSERRAKKHNKERGSTYENKQKKNKKAKKKKHSPTKPRPSKTQKKAKEKIERETLQKRGNYEGIKSTLQPYL